MNTGMLWYDNNPKTDLDSKIIRASDYYTNKYGTKPNLCFIHPSMLKERIKHSSGIEIRTSKQVLPYHFWLGVQKSASKAPVA